jgi:SAM-dependent methyltransferase
LPYKDASTDLVVCINVLDHVRDYDLCMSEMLRVLNKNGCLIIGQDLTNDEDFKMCPETITDVGHPVKVDLDIIRNSLNGMDTLFEKVLPREEGRNPRCHYGTYLGIHIKTGGVHED